MTSKKIGSAGNDNPKLLDEITRRIVAARSRKKKNLDFCGHAKDELALIAQLWEHAEGELDPATERQVTRRLESCAYCARRYRDISQARQSWSQGPMPSMEEVASVMGIKLPQHKSAAATRTAKSRFERARAAVTELVLSLEAGAVRAFGPVGQPVPVTTASRGSQLAGGSGAMWQGAVQFEQTIGKVKLLLTAGPVPGGGCKIQLVSKGVTTSLQGVSGELHRGTKRIYMQPFQKAGRVYKWESDRIQPGQYLIQLKRGSEMLGQMKMTVQGSK